MPESDLRFRVLANSAPVLIWESGKDAACSYFNKAWLEFRGRTLAQEMGNGWAEGVHPHDLERCMQTYLSHFNARTPFEMEYRLRRFDGQYRWILDKGVPHFSPAGEFLGYIGSCLDIQDRKETEESLEQKIRARTEELRQSYRKLELQAQIIDQAIESVIIRDANNVILYWNKGAERVYGWSKEEAIGKNLRELLVSEPPEPWEAIDRRILEDGTWQGELIQTRRDGKRIIVSSTWSLHLSDKKEPAAVLQISRDVTALKTAIEELSRKTERLERFHKLTVNREMDMIRLKREVNDFLEKQGLPKKYKISEPEGVMRSGRGKGVLS